MKTIKEFDSVAMKNEIQRKLLAKHRSMSDSETMADIQRKLAISRSPIGQLWRRLRARSSPTRHLATALR